MGTDIHSLVFEKCKNSTEHHIKAVFNISRHYSLFTALAGVRCIEGIEPVAEPRGLPDWYRPNDAYIASDYPLGDHSFSWLTLAECEEALKRAPDNEFEGIVAYMRSLTDNDGVFFVFGFDS